MRYVIVLITLIAACSYPPPQKGIKAEVWPVSPETHVIKEAVKPVKPKADVKPEAKPAHKCGELETETLEGDIHARLDCIEEKLK